MDDEQFRAALDPATRILRPGALAPPATAYVVFSQGRAVNFPVEALRMQAARFFGCDLGATIDKIVSSPPDVDATQLLVREKGTATETRMVFGQHATADLVANVAEAETRSRTFGMALLAARCPTLWFVECTKPDDRAALILAAVLASVGLGPILTADRQQAIGVKTARHWLADGFPAR